MYRIGDLIIKPWGNARSRQLDVLDIFLASEDLQCSYETQIFGGVICPSAESLDHQDKRNDRCARQVPRRQESARGYDLRPSEEDRLHLRAYAARAEIAYACRIADAHALQRRLVDKNQSVTCTSMHTSFSLMLFFPYLIVVVLFKIMLYLPECICGGAHRSLIIFRA